MTALELAGAAQASDEVAGLQDRARRFLMLAGDRAMALDVGRADVHYQRALALLPPSHPDRATVLAKSAEATQQAGRVVQAEQLFAQVIVELQSQGDRLGAGDAMVRQANVLWYRGETARSRTLVAAAVELLEREPPGPELAAAYLELGKDVAASGQPTQALDWLRKAVSLADRLGADDIRQRRCNFGGAPAVRSAT